MTSAFQLIEQDITSECCLYDSIPWLPELDQFLSFVKQLQVIEADQDRLDVEVIIGIELYVQNSLPITELRLPPARINSQDMADQLEG